VIPVPPDRKARPGRQAPSVPPGRKAKQALKALPGRKVSLGPKGPSAQPAIKASLEPPDLRTPGPRGEKGDKGDKGDPSSAAIRVLAPVGSGQSSSCDAREVMVSAWCIGTYQSYPLRMGQNEASCAAAEDADVQVVVVCAKQ
jgi:hypothetical protein